MTCARLRLAIGTIALATVASAGCSFHSEPVGAAASFPSSGSSDHDSSSHSTGDGKDAAANGGAGAGEDPRDAGSLPTPPTQRDAMVMTHDAGTSDRDSGIDAAAAEPDARVEDAATDASEPDAQPDAEPVDSGSPDCPCVCPHALIDQPEPDPSSSCRPSVCAIDDCAPEPGCRFAVHESSGYYICSDSPGTWNDVKHHCDSVPGVALVSIESNSEDDFLFDELDGEEKTWIGANDRMEEGTFRWETGVVFWRGGPPSSSSSGPGPGGGGPMGGGAPAPGKYANWEGNEPANDGTNNTLGDCVLLWPSLGGWADANCDDEHGYVCEFALPLPGSLPP